jgi:hypothetical protein
MSRSKREARRLTFHQPQATKARYRIAALLRFETNSKGLGEAACGELGREPA